MIRYIFLRLAAAAAALFVVLTLAFCATRLLPGSVYDDPDLAPEAALHLTRRAGLDKPIFTQYSDFLTGLIRGRGWGVSARVEPGVPVFQVLAARIPVSLELNLAALLAALPLGALAGAFAAYKKNGPADAVVSSVTVLSVSVPSFVLAAILQYFPAYRWGLFPILYDPSASFAAKAASMVLPVAALAAGPAAAVARYLRGELSEAMDSCYMLHAKAKGLGPVKAIARHALRNAAIPMLSVVVPMFAHILGGSLIIERLFSIPGVGGVVIRSINAGDHALTVAALLFYAAVSVAAALVVDLCYVLVDPRVRLGGGRRE